MRDGVDPATRLDIVWHESLGIFAFFATLLRLLWVLFRPAVPEVRHGVLDEAGFPRNTHRSLGAAVGNAVHCGHGPGY